MQILLNKGTVKVKMWKSELKTLHDALGLAEAIPDGLGFDAELEAASKALTGLLAVLDPPEDAPAE